MFGARRAVGGLAEPCPHGTRALERAVIDGDAVNVVQHKTRLGHTSGQEAYVYTIQSRTWQCQARRCGTLTHS